MIAIRGLHKSFGDHRVLTGVDLSVAEGSTTVILGGSGSGKTVLMKHIIGLLRPDLGEVWIEGENIAALDGRALDEVRRKFGMVFQASALFDSMTVFENVAFPLREHTRASEEQIARVVHEKLDVVGLREVDGKYPAELSGGMRKRVGLARAIALEPKIVLYDEPTTGLDPITTDYVDEMILEAKKKLGVTSVVISHDVGSAMHIADRIAFLHEGQICAEGPPAELRSSGHPAVTRFLSTWLEKGRA
ncbi:MAG TPA: ABC transporter ATP-binding protein [Myxococcales bacterium]|nr:ABC transporter ATP-binding protein [Myxococcales bacterium]